MNEPKNEVVINRELKQAKIRVGHEGKQYTFLISLDDFKRLEKDFQTNPLLPVVGIVDE